MCNLQLKQLKHRTEEEWSQSTCIVNEWAEFHYASRDSLVHFWGGRRSQSRDWYGQKNRSTKKCHNSKYIAVGNPNNYSYKHNMLSWFCSLLWHSVCLRNDRYCVGWGVKLYSLTWWHSVRNRVGLFDCYQTHAELVCYNTGPCVTGQTASGKLTGYCHEVFPNGRAYWTHTTCAGSGALSGTYVGS